MCDVHDGEHVVIGTLVVVGAQSDVMHDMQTGKGASFSYFGVSLFTISYLTDGVVWALASFLALAQKIR